MSYSLTSKKRKFHRVLESISNATPQKPSAAPLPPSSESKPTPMEGRISSTIKRVRLSQGSTASDDTITRPSTRKITKHPSTSTTSLKPNFVPWDRDRFLERLKTFRKVDRWKPQPDDINEVQWAKRGWSCTGVLRVECVGGCNHSVVVKLPDDIEDFEEYDSENIAERKAVRAQLIEKYQALIIDGHGERCPWRQTGCDDSIHRLPLTKTETALSGLQTRYHNLCSLGEKLPSMEHLVLPETFDIEEMRKILPPDILSKAISADENSNSEHQNQEPADNDDPKAEPLNDQFNAVAFSLASFGWDMSEDGAAGLAECKACFRRLGLWMYKPKDDGSSSLYSGLDVVAEHLDYCPWVNDKTQSGTVKGHNGWEALEQVLQNQHRRKTWSAPSEPQADTPTPNDPSDPGDPSVDNADEETRKAKDREWWARLRRVRQALQAKGMKKGKSVG